MTRSMRPAAQPRLAPPPGQNPEARRGVDAAPAGLRPLETRIGQLAAAQHGVVTRRQLLDAGVAAHLIDSRVRSGRLEVLHRGVYRIRAETTAQHSAIMAALLACGERAAVCRGAAAALWSLPGASREVAVLVAGQHRRVAGISTHRIRAFAAGEVTTLHGLRVTTPARTLLDLARVLSGRALEQAVAQAERDGIMKRHALRALLSRRPRHPGARVIRELLAARTVLAFTRSAAEDRLLALIDHVALPRPLLNHRVAGLEVDCHWPDQKLVVEVDGREHHATASAFHSDRRRDAILVARGLRVMRITWQQLTEDPVATMVRLAQALLAGA